MTWCLMFYARILMSAVLFAGGLFVAMRFADKVGIESLAGYYLFRIMSMSVLVFVLGILPPDVGAFGQYVTATLEGGIPCIDFLSPYSMGFIYLISGASWLFGSGFGIIVVFALAEFVAMIFLYKILMLVTDRAWAVRIIILYLTSPMIFVNSWLGAQDEALVLMFVLMCLFFILKGWPTGVWLITLLLMIFFTKILVVFFVGPILLLKRARGLLLCCICMIAYVGVMFLIGANPFNFAYAASDAVDKLQAGGSVLNNLTLGNIWYYLKRVPPTVQVAAFLLVSGFIGLTLKPTSNRQSELRYAGGVAVLMTLVFSLLYKMVYSPYMIPMFPFLIFLVITKRDKFVSFDTCALVLWCFCAAFKDAYFYGARAGRLGWVGSVFSIDVFNGVMLVLTGLVIVQVLRILKEERSTVAGVMRWFFNWDSAESKDLDECRRAIVC